MVTGGGEPGDGELVGAGDEGAGVDFAVEGAGAVDGGLLFFWGGGGGGVGGCEGGEGEEGEGEEGGVGESHWWIVCGGCGGGMSV